MNYPQREEIELTSSSSSSSESSRNQSHKRSLQIRKYDRSMKTHTIEEQMAFCLMMLSRDKWRREEEETLLTDLDTDESEELIKKPSKLKTRASRAKYKCETCNKVFKSYQALGGHRASHKKMRSYGGGAAVKDVAEVEIESNVGGASTSSPADRKTHGCPFCSRVFSSGQALGGHKRSHVTGAALAGSAAVALPRNLTRSASASVEKLIDLNLPAPAEEDEISQVVVSGVSDAEFVHRVRR